LRADYAEAFNNRGVVLRELGRLDQALASCERAIVLKPDFADAFRNRGDALRDLKRLPEAVQCYERARALDPALPYIDGSVLHARMMIGDWTDLAPSIARILAGVERGAAAALPFQLLSVPSTPAQQRRCGRYAPLQRANDGERVAVGRLAGAHVSRRDVHQPYRRQPARRDRLAGARRTFPRGIRGTRAASRDASR
jgi:tetratricopeptide (TPR) repeat protein